MACSASSIVYVLRAFDGSSPLSNDTADPSRDWFRIFEQDAALQHSPESSSGRR